MKSVTATRYPVVNYNPESYVPLSLFQSQWNNMKATAGELMDDFYRESRKKNALGELFEAIAPITLLISMLILSLFARPISTANAFSTFMQQPFVWFLLAAFGFSALSVFNRSRFSSDEKRALDFSVMESARRYLRQRYGFLPQNWEERFTSYLAGEEVKDDRFSETYQLTVRNYRGYDVLMVTNMHGEAPVRDGEE